MERKGRSAGQEVLLVESNSLNDCRVIVTSRDNVIAIDTVPKLKITDSIVDVLKRIFLPSGYPDSVSGDYWDYQVWDTAQAFCSTITCGLTTHAVLKGVGVGNSDATPLAAAITWILKDGTGMIGRILFAWLKGATLDADCKKWRFIADILNDIALILEFLLPFVFSISTYVLCLTTTLKSIVGVAGGATRASITQHQALRNNMADVAAKDSSQETCVNLLASFVAIYLMMMLEESDNLKWMVFMLLTVMHLIFNYCAVRSLIFTHLNETRLLIVLKTYLHHTTVAPPRPVNKVEPILMGTWPRVKNVCGFQVKMGESLAEHFKEMTVEEISILTDVFNSMNYMVFPNVKKQIMYVAFKPNANSEDIIGAYFHAVIFGIALCSYNDVDLKFNKRRQLHHTTPLDRLNNVMKSDVVDGDENFFLFPLDLFVTFAELMVTERTNFFTALNVNNWNVGINSLRIGNYRITLPADKKNN